MIGKPLMTTPFSSAASRATTTGPPLLFGPSPEISMTRRKPRCGFSSNSGIAKLIAPEIEVRDARRGLLVGQLLAWRMAKLVPRAGRGHASDIAAGENACHKHGPDRDIPAHCCPPVD